MSNWIDQHPYLFMILMIYVVTTINQMVVRVAENKYSYREDDM